MINPYGILLSISILVCILVVRNLSKETDETVWGLAFWTILFGIIGARLFHVVSDFEIYKNNLVSALYVWNGGLGIWGAVGGGTLGALIYLIKEKKPVLKLLDICFVSLPLGQAIGRWGNYFNKEVYGPVTSLPWGILIDGRKRHPIFLYESILNLINFFILYSLYKKTQLKNKKGIFIALYFMGYSTIRFCMEFLRQDHWLLMGLNVSFMIPILLFMAALFSLLILCRRKA